jgi:hypothetical protein
MNILSGADARGEPADLNGQGQSYGSMSGNESEPTMMWISNYGGPMYGFQTYVKAPMMLSMLGGMVGDEAVQAAIKKYTEAWSFKHPSPWDFANFLSHELEEDLGWFWYYWLFTTESVDGSIEDVTMSGSRTVVTVRQDGEMPSPVVLAIQFASADPRPVEAAHGSLPDTQFREDGTAIVTWPVDVWFDGRRTFEAELDFGGREIETITLDPDGRFPDRNPADNFWRQGD